MADTEIFVDDVSDEHIGRVLTLEHPNGVITCGKLVYFKRNAMGLHLLFEGGQDHSLLPPPPKKAFRAQEEASHPRIFVRTD